ncbi:hypothetical protein CIG75_09105 [Tumebacillus algifaecis]|uniref:Oxidoreductase n=1 Tax=Tumebacillus algifaecis TaxID=1214604 RepID=A0A223D0I1_9BACL|nr:SDR family NAD(P)-dependent oxidoreductase [Tumebacillus algifaecis]ASS75120.1 hypothetical protein CIG75_09105 [Tumebacillus algifaecis]
MLMLQNQIVLITGASSGIGRDAALLFAKHGALPVLTARSIDKLEALSAEIKQLYNIEAPFYALDVTDGEQVERVVAEVLRRFTRIDLLLNSSGYGLFIPTDEIAMEEVEGMMNVNYFGLVRVTKAVLPSMQKRNSGHIINLASIASFMAGKKHGAYAATKHAVMGFSDALRYELHGTGVTLSTINPGPVETPFFDRADRKSVPKLVRFLTSEEVAATVLKAAVQKKPLYLMPKSAGIPVKLRHLFPRLYDWAMSIVK